MNLRLLAALAAVAVLLMANTVSAAPARPDRRSSVVSMPPGSNPKITDQTPMYIVQLAGEPAATYQGGSGTLKATSPLATGEVKLDATAPETVAYVDHLLAQQDSFTTAMEAALGRDVVVLFNYRYALNGIAVAISAQEAEVVGSLPGVTEVTANTIEHLETDAGPAWIGAPGVWDGSGVPDGTSTMGEGVVVGVLDTGINMDHPSFAAVGGDGYVHTNPLPGSYKGWCDPENPNYNAAYLCNEKLIGLWSMTQDATPEDEDGHGSHTSSTAAGNVITATFRTPTMVMGPTPLQGVAPHANIIMYDVCAGGCPTVATTAALDQALNDGVDVTNYSISGTGGTVWSNDNPTHVAYRNLRAAGVSAAVSAGNAGPGAGTTAALGPWMASVGASTHNRAFDAWVKDMVGGATAPPANILGRSVADGYGPASVVWAEGYVNSTGQPDDGMCNSAFPAGTFPNGEIVLCDRGIEGRVQKGLNVLAGGAGGYILANDVNSGNSLVSDTHELPAVHISFDNGVILKAWLRDTGTGHMATLSGTTVGRDPSNADIMASFSGRGPSYIGQCCLRPWGINGSKLMDILKPDVTLPGVDILAAWSTDPDDPAPEPELNSISGTSMSGPHMAGAFALMKALHPEWTVAERQSALMLTAVTEGLRKEDGITPADPLDYGAGRVNVSQAASTGLVMDMSLDDAVAADPGQGGDPSALNLASMANFRCRGVCSWTRTVRSVWPEEVTWNLSASGEDGMELDVVPATLTLAPGAMGTFTATADASAVVPDSNAFGQVILEPSEAGPYPAHVNVAVIAPSLAMPPMVNSEDPSLEVGYTARTEGEWVISGFRSKTVPNVTASAVGFLIPEQVDVAVEPDLTPGDVWDSPAGTTTTVFPVPEGALRVVAETKRTTAVDIDLYLGIDLNGDGAAQENEAACVSAGPTWEEYCDIRNPPAANWWVLMQNWEGGGEATDDLSYLYGALTEGGTSMTVSAPASVENAVPWDLTIGWDFDSIEPGDVFYGVVRLGTGAGEPDDFLNLGFDLLTIEQPSIFLPDVRNRYIEVVPPAPTIAP